MTAELHVREELLPAFKTFEWQKSNLKYYLASQKGKLITCAGMERAGSTWLFNATRLLLMSSNKYVYGFWIDDFNFAKFMLKAKLKSHLLLKTHKYIDSLEKHSSIILTSIRDLRDVATSLARMWGYNIDKIIKTSTIIDIE